MRIVIALDGSECALRALDFVVTHQGMLVLGHSLTVLNVQPPLPPRVAPMVGSDAVQAFHRDEADKVLDSARILFATHAIAYRAEWVLGQPADAIVKVCQREQAELLVLGTHGRGALGRLLMGSVAQHVVAQCDVPTLLIH